MRRGLLLLAALLLLAGALPVRALEDPAALGRPPDAYPIPPEPAPFPAGGRTLTVSPAGPFRSPSEALAAAAPGDTVAIEGGTYQERLTVTKPVRIIGSGWPVIDGGGKGTVIQVKAPRVEISGLVVRGSGDNLAAENAAIAVGGAGALIHGNRIEEALFGIYLREAAYSAVTGNEIRGMNEYVALRGDAIRIWYSPVTRIEGNRVTGGRDVVVWFSDLTVLRENDVSGSRYGLHFMWSHDGTVENNRLYGNSVGVFIMYSNRMTVRRNALYGNRGPSGYGLAFKDAEMAVAEQNWLTGNRVGLYLDNAPYTQAGWNRFSANVISGNDTGLLLMPATHGNTFVGNDFIDNAQQVELTAAGELGANLWAEGGRGNHWSDYAGYDLAGDGIGDQPYRPVSLFEDLMARHSALRWFRHSPAAAAVDLAARAFPAVAPQPILSDPAPLTAPALAGGFRPEGAAGAGGKGLALVSSLMLAAAGAVWGLLLAGRVNREVGGCD